MLKIGTDGSVKNKIVGCPGCDTDGTENMTYYNSQWYYDKYTKIMCCPFCGMKLPPLDGWIVIKVNTYHT